MSVTGRVERLVREVSKKNVRYHNGVPRSLPSIETVVEVPLVSPQINLSFASGGVANTTSLDPTVRIDTFSRWVSIYKQYLVAKIVVISTISNTGSYIGKIFVQVGEDSATPSGVIVREERAELSLATYQSEASSTVVTVWEPQSAEDVTWTNTNTGSALAYLRTYADPTNTGTTGADSATRITHQVYYTMMFRYLY